MDHRFLIPAALFLSSLAVRSVYELLKEARRINLESKLIFAVILSTMFILWMSWFSLPEADPVPVDLPEVVRWVALSVFIIGTILAVGALIQLRGVENIDHLVTTGLHSKLRHPMYTGFILWIAGWIICGGTVAGGVIGIIAIADILFWRRWEEIKLIAEFGDIYRTYKERTWF